ncbi:MAG: hypothetical protein IPH75_04370 [bacterium]|nr:hypothetical protein [bacterium]
MQDSDRPAEQIEQIHAIMARSTTFLSLSGLSGLAAGIMAFGGLWLIYRLLGTIWLTDVVLAAFRESPSLVSSLTGLFVWTLVAALTGAFLLTLRRASRYHTGLWNLASQRFALHLALPLLAGGLFILALNHQGAYALICPAMLIFFGLALINCGKYSFSEISWLGLIELALGVIAAVWVEGGLLLWGIGFGAVTAGYGLVMYLKYER